MSPNHRTAEFRERVGRDKPQITKGAYTPKPRFIPYTPSSQGCIMIPWFISLCFSLFVVAAIIWEGLRGTR